MNNSVRHLHYDYPLKYDQHMLHVPDLVALPTTDENYPYVNTGRWFRLMQAILHFFICTFAYVVLILSFGLRIHNRKLLRQYRDQLKNGAVTICNHVHMWDYICVLLAIRPRAQYHAAWLTNLKGPNRRLIRLVGGIPVPTNIVGLKKFDQAVNGVLSSGKWFHMFAEGSMWYYYDKIRPFKKGAFTYAVKHNVPIVPLVISYRPRRGITRLFTDKPLLDITICQPCLPNMALPKQESVLSLLADCRTKMQSSSGFEQLIDQNATCRDESVN